MVCAFQSQEKGTSKISEENMKSKCHFASGKIRENLGLVGVYLHVRMYLSYFDSKHRLWVLVTTASARRF